MRHTGRVDGRAPAPVVRTVLTLHGRDAGTLRTTAAVVLSSPSLDRPLRSAPMTELDDTPTDSTGPSRRRIAQAAGWSVPLVIAAVGAPAAQASVTPVPFDGLTGTWSSPVMNSYEITQAVLTITNTSAQPQSLRTLQFVYTTGTHRSLIVGAAGFTSESSHDPRWPELYVVMAYGDRLLQPGQSIRFQGEMNRTGETVSIETSAGDAPGQASISWVDMI
jgi:hypothetical protein